MQQRPHRGFTRGQVWKKSMIVEAKEYYLKKKGKDLFLFEK